MLPKVEIKLSPPYFHIMSDDFSYANYRKNPVKEIEKFFKRFKKFEKRTKSFQKAFGKKKRKILTLIEKYSGYKWKGQFIPIYLVEMTQKPSFADPLTLKFRDNIDMMLLLVIHEMTHINLPNKMQWDVGTHTSENWVNLITRNVASDLKVDLKQAPMNNFDEALELGWDLKKKPLRKYL